MKALTVALAISGCGDGGDVKVTAPPPGKPDTPTTKLSSLMEGIQEACRDFVPSNDPDPSKGPIGDGHLHIIDRGENGRVLSDEQLLLAIYEHIHEMNAGGVEISVLSSPHFSDSDLAAAKRLDRIAMDVAAVCRGRIFVLLTGFVPDADESNRDEQLAYIQNGIDEPGVVGVSAIAQHADSSRDISHSIESPTLQRILDILDAKGKIFDFQAADADADDDGRLMDRMCEFAGVRDRTTFVQFGGLGRVGNWEQPNCQLPNWMNLGFVNGIGRIARGEMDHKSAVTGSDYTLGKNVGRVVPYAEYPPAFRAELETLLVTFPPAIVSDVAIGNLRRILGPAE